MVWQSAITTTNKKLLAFLQCAVWLLILKLLFGASVSSAQCTNCTTSLAANGDVILTFTSGSGTFTPPAGVTSVQYLVVGGGGGGGGIPGSFWGTVRGAGGGGGGGVRSGTLNITSLTNYNVEVGGGGVPGIGNNRPGGTGEASSFGPITATGGGGGASEGYSATSGGSGGGGRANGNGAAGIAGQGNRGGNGPGNVAGGGGGAGAAGSNGSGNNGGAGGAGVANAITGSNVTYAGGGGGGGYSPPFGSGAGGVGGAGGGGSAPNGRGSGSDGTPNTGGGGGGASGGAAFIIAADSGGAGGSGIVIIRYTPGGVRYAVNNGNWNSTNTWSAINCNGIAGASVPVATDDVVICNNRTVTLTAAAVANSVVLEAGGSGVNLNHSANISLTVGSGGVTINGSTDNNVSKSWNIGAGSATVNGPVRLNGGNTNNRPARINLTSGTLDINGNLIISSNSLDAAFIQATGAANIFLSGGLTIPGGSGRILPGTSSTFTYDGTGTQTVMLGVSDINYHNLVLAGSGTKTQTSWGVPVITGRTQVNQSVTFENSSAVNYQGEFINNGTTRATAQNQYLNNFINNGIFEATSNLQYRANFTNSGTFTSGTGLHLFNGNSLQQINGATTFYRMELNNSAGLSISNDVTVQEHIILTNGPLITSNNVLRVAQTGGWSGVSRGSGWIAGNLGLWMPISYQGRTWDIGDATAYRPVTITIPSVVTAGFIVVSVSQTNGDHPQINSADLDAARSVNRWWSITSEGVTMVAMDVVFNYLASDIDAGATPQNFEIQHYNGSVWSDVTVDSRSATNSRGTAITTFGQFAIAEPGLSIPVCTTLVSGIIGQYFNNTSLSGAPVATRIDGPINFDWTSNNPGVPGVNADQFSIRWDGLLRVTQSGNYRFQTVSDDGVRLWINDVLVINNWNDHSSAIDTSNQIALVADQTYSIRLEFYENGGVAQMRLRWLTPGSSTYVPIPAGPTPQLGAGLYHCATTQICSGVEPSGGILGEYFNNISMSGTPAGTRVDGPIDYIWNQSPPGVSGVNTDEFSIRWNGRLRVTVTGNYQFQTRSDDGVRLWVNEQLLINQWTDHSATDHTSGNLYLVAGQVYPIRTEFYERFTDAEIRLRWRVPGTSSFVAIPRGPTPAVGSGLYYCPTAPVVSYYTIAHSGNGVTCEAEPVIITARDINGDAIAPPAGTTAVLATVPATGVWVGGNSFVFSGTETSFIKYLQQLTPATLNINVSDGTATEIASADPDIVFSDVGFRFYGDASLNPMQNQVAGMVNAAPIIRAVQTNTDNGACEARVAGAHTVQMAYECVNPLSCSAGQTFTANGSVVAANPSGNITNYSAVSLNFDNTGTASIPLNFSDVGMVRLHAMLPMAASDSDPPFILTGSSSPFVVKPYTLVVSNVANNPGTTSAGRGFIAAGESFSVAVEARNSAGNITPNFGNETTSQRSNVALKVAELIYPADGFEAELAGANAGSFSATTTAGRMQNNNVSWSEVGTIRLQPVLESNDYLGAGDLVTLTPSGPVGRFYPAHFELSYAETKNSCDSFSYLNDTGVELVYRVEARAVGGNITTNYHSSTYAGTATSTIYAEENDQLNLSSRVMVSPATWINGVMDFDTGNAAINITVTRQASGQPDGPFSNLQLGLGMRDNLDNRQLINLDMNADTRGNCVDINSCNAVKLGDTLSLVYGRMHIKDAFGSEHSPLPMFWQTEFWNGRSFGVNTADSCTELALGRVSFSGASTSVNPANDTISVTLGGATSIFNFSDPDPSDFIGDGLTATAIAFQNGRAGIQYGAPGAQAIYPISIDLSDIPHLQYDWNQDGNYSDVLMPRVDIRFSNYRGHDRIIYWREDLR